MFRKLTTNAFAEGDLCAKDQKDQKNQKPKNKTLSAGEVDLAGGDPCGSCEAYPPVNQTKLRAWNSCHGFFGNMEFQPGNAI